MSEIWGAIEKTRDGRIVFNVLDKQTGVMRQERLDEQGLLAMMEKSYPSPMIAESLMGLELPWFFSKDGMYTYLDGPSCYDNPNYHPVGIGYQIELLMWEADQPQAQPAPGD